MSLMTFTKVVPSTSIAGYSVFVGIAFFFLVEAVDKISDGESGLQFKSFVKDLKKSWVLPLLVVQVVIAAFGEEIAWRGFFLGKSMKMFPFWLFYYKKKYQKY